MALIDIPIKSVWGKPIEFQYNSNDKHEVSKSKKSDVWRNMDGQVK